MYNMFLKKWMNGKMKWGRVTEIFSFKSTSEIVIWKLAVGTMFKLGVRLCADGDVEDAEKHINDKSFRTLKVNIVSVLYFGKFCFIFVLM